MGLLTEQEQTKLLDLLEKLPNSESNDMRRLLSMNQPRSLRLLIKDLPSPREHLMHMISMLNEQSTSPYEGIWPIIQLLKQALNYIKPASPVGQLLQQLLMQAEQRAQQRDYWLTTFKGLPPQNLSQLERMIDPALGFLNPGKWRSRMRQGELATCLISFTGYSPAARGTGFLVGPDLLMTNYHVMADVLHDAIKPKDVSFVFDYSENSNNRKKVYHLAPNFPLDWSSEEDLDYILLRVNGMPGNDLVERTARGWLQPLKHSFLEGEPLFIVQHPNGGPLKFAFDRVKWCEETRITYWTNTEQGSSGAPCFTFTWDLVALHQCVTHPGIDAERPNMGIPFSRILERPKIQSILPG